MKNLRHVSLRQNLKKRHRNPRSPLDEQSEQSCLIQSVKWRNYQNILNKLLNGLATCHGIMRGIHVGLG